MILEINTHIYQMFMPLKKSILINFSIKNGYVFIYYNESQLNFLMPNYIYHTITKNQKNSINITHLENKCFN